MARSLPAATPPDVLVLGGGGIVGEAWMNGVLAGLDEAEGFDSRACRRYVGTSAGSIVAAVLAAGVSPASRLGRLPEQPPADGDGPGGGSPPLRRALGAVAAVGGSVAAPAVSLALRSAAPGGAVVRRALLARVPRGRGSLEPLRREIERLGLRFDGRLLVSVVELESGRRLMLGSADAPELPVARAVQASCAIPGVFAPVRVDGRSYVDGGAWSPTSLDVCGAGRGDRVLCLNPTASLRPRLGDIAGAFGPVSRSIAAAEALVLRRRGARVTVVNPDGASSAAMGSNLMNPRRRAGTIEAGLAQGRALAGRGGW
ncbi:MAG TPA: patatin-like phospholipase family protein [Thermoleophilaceae bacterium]